MRNFQHPATGEHSLASDDSAADKLIEEGWEEIVDASADDEPAAEQKVTKPSRAKAPAPLEPAADDDCAKTPDPDKPLNGMKLRELIAYAETVGVDADTLATLRKPGASKKAAIDAITAHVANA